MQFTRSMRSRSSATARPTTSSWSWASLFCSQPSGKWSLKGFKWGMTNQPLIVAITACPTGIAHTYVAAENLEAAAMDLGYRIKIEPRGSIGVEGHFTAEDIENADAIVIVADTVINKE